MRITATRWNERELIFKTRWPNEWWTTYRMTILSAAFVWVVTPTLGFFPVDTRFADSAFLITFSKQSSVQTPINSNVPTTAGMSENPGQTRPYASGRTPFLWTRLYRVFSRPFKVTSMEGMRHRNPSPRVLMLELVPGEDKCLQDQDRYDPKDKADDSNKARVLLHLLLSTRAMNWLV